MERYQDQYTQQRGQSSWQQGPRGDRDRYESPGWREHDGGRGDWEGASQSSSRPFEQGPPGRQPYSAQYGGAQYAGQYGSEYSSAHGGPGQRSHAYQQSYGPQYPAGGSGAGYREGDDARGQYGGQYGGQYSGPYPGPYPGNYPGQYSGQYSSNYPGSSRGNWGSGFGSQTDFGYDRASRSDMRPWSHRAGDEVRSWFGDEEAQRRREMDERRAVMQGDSWRQRSGSSSGYGADDDPYGTSRGSAGYGGSQYGGGGGPAGFAYGQSSGAGAYGTPTLYGVAYGITTTYGRYSGRGPRGWKRGDEQIMHDVCQRLTDHPDIDASDIEVKVDSGEVTLSGTVHERRIKRLAEDIAEGVSGAGEVTNNIRVKREHDYAVAGSEGAGAGGMSRSGSTWETKSTGSGSGRESSSSSASAATRQST